MPAPRRIPPVRPTAANPDAGTVASAAKREGEPVGKLLVNAGSITREQLSAALASQRKSFKPLGRILREEHGLSDEILAAALRKQDTAPRVFLRFFPIPPETQHLLETPFCRHHEAVAFEKLGKMLCVAFANPDTRHLLRHIEMLTSLEVQAFSAPWEDIDRQLMIG